MSDKQLNLVLCLLMFFFIGFLCGKAHADEPPFCQLENFKKHEIATNNPDVKRLRAFKFGEATMMGLEVGGSPASATAKLGPADCIWYFNRGNHDAEKMFNWVYLPGPYWGWFPGAHWLIAHIYDKRLQQQADKIVSCLTGRKVFIGGCDGQRHRGPSVHAWIYSLAGCSAKHATQLVDYAWKLNGVPFYGREEIAEKGYELGDRRPELRKALQSVMLK